MAYSFGIVAFNGDKSDPDKNGKKNDAS